MDHIDEDVEAYAIGLLDDETRRRIDDHVRTCDACAGRLGQAEEAVASIVVASQRAPLAVTRWPFAVAAVLAIASSALLAQDIVLHRAVAEDGSAMVALVQSHFAHVQFTDATGAPVNAKVIYDRNGAWLDIVITGEPPAGVRLVRRTGSSSIVGRAFAQRGNASTLYVAHPGALRVIELIDRNGRTIASARPTASERE